jgi:hypothetical protein
MASAKAATAASVTREETRPSFLFISKIPPILEASISYLDIKWNISAENLR